MLTFYKSLRDICGAKTKGMPEPDIVDTLGVFYDREMILGILNELSKPELIFEHYGKLQCWDCSSCSVGFSVLDGVNPCLPYIFSNAYISESCSI